MGERYSTVSLRGQQSAGQCLNEQHEPTLGKPDQENTDFPQLEAKSVESGTAPSKLVVPGRFPLGSLHPRSITILTQPVFIHHHDFHTKTESDWPIYLSLRAHALLDSPLTRP